MRVCLEWAAPLDLLQMNPRPNVEIVYKTREFVSVVFETRVWEFQAKKHALLGVTVVETVKQLIDLKSKRLWMNSSGDKQINATTEDNFLILAAVVQSVGLCSLQC